MAQLKAQGVDMDEDHLENTWEDLQRKMATAPEEPPSTKPGGRNPTSLPLMGWLNQGNSPWLSAEDMPWLTRVFASVLALYVFFFCGQQVQRYGWVGFCCPACTSGRRVEYRRKQEAARADEAAKAQLKMDMDEYRAALRMAVLEHKRKVAEGGGSGVADDTEEEKEATATAARKRRTAGWQDQ